MRRLLPLLPLTLLLLFFLPSCAKTSSERPRTAYAIQAELDAANNALSVKTEISYSLPQDGLSAVKLRLYPNAYGEGKTVVSAEKTKAAYPKGASYGGAEVLSVDSSAGVKDYALGVEDDTVLTVRFPEKHKKGEKISLSIEIAVSLATVKHRLGAYGGYYVLSGFYPAVCPFEGGKFREDPVLPYGDPFRFEASDFSVRFTLPVGYEAAASAPPLSRESQGRKAIFSYSLEGARNFAIVASDRLRSAETQVGGVPIRYYYETDKKSAELLETSASAFRLFEQTFGSYPYPALTLVSAPFAEAGMEFSGLALLSNELSSGAKKQTAVHEIAHQWWFGKVGFDEYASPWMDEGLAEFSTAYYLKASGFDSAYRAMLANADEDYSIYLSIKGAAACRTDAQLSELSDCYAEIAYSRSLLLFSSLAEIEGYERTNAALKSFAECFEGKIACPSDLIAALSDGLEKDLSSFFEKWLGNELPAP